MRKRKPYEGYIFGSLRKIWRWSKERKEALNAGHQEHEGKCNDKRCEYFCVCCEGRFKRKGVAIDHKEPVVDPRKGFEGWDTYITRLFCPSTGLQLLCTDCHKKKTKDENKVRREFKCKKS